MSKEMFTALKKQTSTVLELDWSKQNYFSQSADQLAALLASGQKLVTKTYFWAVCSKQAVASK